MHNLGRSSAEQAGASQRAGPALHNHPLQCCNAPAPRTSRHPRLGLPHAAATCTTHHRGTLDSASPTRPLPAPRPPAQVKLNELGPVTKPGSGRRTGPLAIDFRPWESQVGCVGREP